MKKVLLESSTILILVRIFPDVQCSWFNVRSFLCLNWRTLKDVFPIMNESCIESNQKVIEIGTKFEVHFLQIAWLKKESWKFWKKNWSSRTSRKWKWKNFLMVTKRGRRKDGKNILFPVTIIYSCHSLPFAMRACILSFILYQNVRMRIKR